MPTGAIPQNQLDSLPILTVAQVAQGGDVQVVGATIYRSFSPDQLGLNAAAYNPATMLFDTYRVLVTPYLDLRGCSKHSLTLRTFNNFAGVRPAFGPIIVYAQTRQGPADTPGPTYLNGGANAPANNSCTSVSPHGATTFPATAAANELQTMIWAWSPSQPSLNSNYAVVIGANTRLLIFLTGAGVALPFPVGGAETNNFFTAYLESS